MRKTIISVGVVDDLYAQIERDRGDVSRSRFVERILEFCYGYNELSGLPKVPPRLQELIDNKQREG